MSSDILPYSEEDIDRHGKSIGKSLGELAPDLDSLFQFPDPVLACTGISLKPAQSGGWLCIIKIRIGKPAPKMAAPGNLPAGDYVGYAFGPTPFDALGALCAKFAADDLSLSPDRFSSTPGMTPKAPKMPKTPRKGAGDRG
jgi:hypothetical protein